MVKKFTLIDRKSPSYESMRRRARCTTSRKDRRGKGVVEPTIAAAGLRLTERSPSLWIIVARVTGERTRLSRCDGEGKNLRRLGIWSTSASPNFLQRAFDISDSSVPIKMGLLFQGRFFVRQESNTGAPGDGRCEEAVHANTLFSHERGKFLVVGSGGRTPSISLVRRLILGTFSSLRREFSDNCFWQANCSLLVWGLRLMVRR